MRIGEEQARALVRARLGREPADFLESAVVLEAWGGLRAPVALDVAPAWRPDGASPAERMTLRDEPEPPRPSGWLVVASVLSTALYLFVLHRHLPGRVVDDAWRSVLPVALAWQWAVRRRYVGGSRRLDHDRRLLAVAALGSLTVVSAIGSGATLVASLILLPWCAAALVVGRPLATRSAAALLAAAVAALVMPVLLALATPGLVAVLVVVRAVRHESNGQAPAPAPWRAALPAVVPGFALGLLILAAPAVQGSITGLATVAALLPSLLGNHAAGAHLRRLWEVDSSPRSVVVRALAISMLVTTVGSGALLAIADVTSDVDLAGLAALLAFLLLVSVLTFPLILLDAFRFDAALVSIGAVTLAILAAGLGAAPAVLATGVAVAASAALVGRLLLDGNRLRAMPG